MCAPVLNLQTMSCGTPAKVFRATLTVGHIEINDNVFRTDSVLSFYYANALLDLVTCWNKKQHINSMHVAMDTRM